MAEMLVVVAIIAILGGVVFINVINYQRSMAQFERDNIAKEIFVAAQNHLTMAESQGYLGLKENNDPSIPQDAFGYKDADDTNVRYLVVNGSGSFDGGTVLDQMLPFASVDETVRTGGSYIVQYQMRPALVLNVFYCSKGVGRFDHTLTVADYTGTDSIKKVASNDGENKEKRRSYSESKYVLGWYGGEDAKSLENMKDLKEPSIKVENAERLTIKVSDPNSGIISDKVIKLIITGETSDAQKAFTLNGTSRDERVKLAETNTYAIILDDVTAGDMYKFSNLSATNGTFIPGENISVQAVVYNKGALSNIAYSDKKTTNSLFAEISKPDGTLTNTATIRNIRHLENLDNNISNLKDYSESGVTRPRTLKVRNAVQATDLNWTDFREKIVANYLRNTPYTSADQVAVYNVTNTPTKAGCYMPVSPSYNLTYDGKDHSIINIQVDNSGPSGVFGTLSDSTIQNVAVHNTPDNDSGLLIKGTGDTGGLVGVMNGGTIDQCAAAVYVKSETGAAGGLVGSATSGVSITNSYSGGHTVNGQYLNELEVTTPGHLNVIGTTAGGLIGDAGNAAITNCYSTCSVSGTTAGGLVGTSSGTIQKCYVTGLINGVGDNPTLGAFAGNWTGTKTAADENYYFEGMNPPEEDEENGLGPVNGNEATGIQAFDKDIVTYQKVFQQTPLGSASPYDSFLRTNYGGKYPLNTISGLNTSLTGLIATTHYGDWPKPAWEAFFVNEPA